MPFITICHVDGVNILSGCGHFEANDAYDLTRALNIALISKEIVMVDLVKAHYIDEAILPCLLVLARALSRRNQRLKVMVSQNTQPECLLIGANLDEWMDITPQ